MKIYSYLVGVILTLASLTLHANTPPTISPTAVFVTEDGEEQSSDYSGTAPVVAKFFAHVQDAEGWKANYEWRFYSDADAQNPYLIRYEENTEFTFKQSGNHFVKLYATFIQGKDTILYAQEYWTQQQPIAISIAESRLEMPNAFSPNGDGINDVYKAKEGFQSIIEFNASIYNRWGQKLFEWNNPAEGWDGKFNGTDAKQGVYFVVVKAKGADGKVFHIRRDVNLLRGYTETSRQ